MHIMTDRIAHSTLAGTVVAALLTGAAWAQAPAVSDGHQGAHSVELPQTWPPSDVTHELARCAQMMHGLGIVARPLPPLRENDCGAPAPLELISVGQSPQVTFSPPVTVTCELAVALHQWIKNDLQPLAQRHLGAEIIRIDTMSSYSCRTAYGRKNGKLSEHARANAVDIRSFMTARGESSAVLADWGPTGREIAAQVAAAKKLEAEARLAKHPVRLPNIVASGSAPVTAGVTTGAISTSGVSAGLKPSISVGTRESGSGLLPLPFGDETDVGLTGTNIGRNRLGGPKSDGSMSEDSGARTNFLRSAHDSACSIFGTVLGPEANAAHRNHFHVDMAERKIKAICE